MLYDVIYMMKTYGDSNFQVTTATIEGYHATPRHSYRETENIFNASNKQGVADCWSLVLGPASQDYISQRVPSRGTDFIHGDDHQSARGLGLGDNWWPTGLGSG